MADTTALKNRIRAAIKANDNQEITGPVLQQALLDIVDELNGATETEASARQSADSTLQQNITTEKNRAEEVETQLNSLITGIKNNIDNGYVYAGIAVPTTAPVSGKVFYVAVQAGTYTNFGGKAVTEGITILRYNGTSWVKEQVLFTDGGVFDISAYNLTNGQPTPYVDLATALGTNGANIPESLRKGGMSVKFIQGTVQNSDNNKYVQYRLMSSSFDTTETNWQSSNPLQETGQSTTIPMSQKAVTDLVEPFYGFNGVLRFFSAYHTNKYPLISQGSVVLTEGVNIDTLQIKASIINSLIVKDAPYNTPYHGITITNSDNLILSYYNSTCNISSSALANAEYVYITFRRETASSPIPTEVILNGMPLTQGMFYDALVLNCADIPEKDNKKPFNSDGAYKAMLPFYAANNILKFVLEDYKECTYPNKDGGKVNFAPTPAIDTIVLDATKISSIAVSDAPYNPSGYYGITLTDAEKNIVDYGTTSYSSSISSGIRYIFIAFRNKNASGYQPTKVVIDGYPVTINAFRNAFDSAFADSLDNEPTADHESKSVKSSALAKLTSGLIQEFDVTQGENSGSNSVFKIGNLTNGKRVGFILLCDNGVVDTYSFRGNAGAFLVGTGYDFVPNKFYTLNANLTGAPDTYFGCYISSGRAIGSGHAKFICYADFWKLADNYLADMIVDLQNKYPDIFSSVLNNHLFFNSVLNTITIFKKKYPAADITPDVVRLTDHATINTYRIDLSLAPVNSIIAGGLNYNGDHYYALTLTDENNNILSHISSESVSVTNFGQARYCYLAGKQNVIDLIINGYPYTNYSFSKAVQASALKTLEGKAMWTIWDSLGINSWQTYFMNLTGIQFRPDLNTKRDFALSVGGTSTFPDEVEGGQARTLRLASYKDTYPMDYIFVENVNDGRSLVDANGDPIASKIGTKNDKAFMLSGYKIISPQEFSSNAAARSWIENNWSTFLSYFTTSEKKAGVIVRIPITPSDQSAPNGSKITFSGTVTSAGQISLKWNHETFAVSVEVGDTLQDIVDKFLNYNFGSGCYDVDGGNGSLIVFSDWLSSRITDFVGGDTGISATIVDAKGAGDYCWTFLGDTAAEFDDISNWNNVAVLTMWSVYKGLISYLQRTFPTSNIYWVIPFSLNPGPATNNPYKDANGNYDMDLYKNYPGYKNRINLFNIQREVCEYYGIPVIDLFTKSGLGISNIETYIPYNDVHPRSIGYQRYAEYMVKLMGIG